MDRSGRRVELIFCVKRSSISLIKNPDLSRASSVVAESILNANFAIFSKSAFVSITFTAQSGNLGAKQTQHLAYFIH